MFEMIRKQKEEKEKRGKKQKHKETFLTS